MSSFGTTHTPHLLSQRWMDGGWQPVEVGPFADVALSPFTQALHYGQSIFEGMQAYRQPDGTLALFRPADHLRRLNISAARLCLPAVEVDDLLDALCGLIEMDNSHAPEPPGTLYVRPLMFADEAYLSPRIPSSARLLVMLSPSHGYFGKPDGLRIASADGFIRAAAGGTGSAKCAGNYAGTLFHTQQAREAGFDEVLWLDAKERRYLEETGTTNVFLVRDGAVCTPSLSDTILAGMTRNTLLQLAGDAGIEVCECRIATDLSDWEGVTEVFTSGTASGVVHVREVAHRGETLFSRDTVGPITTQLKRELRACQFGNSPDPYGWRMPTANRRNSEVGGSVRPDSAGA